MKVLLANSTLESVRALVIQKQYFSTLRDLLYNFPDHVSKEGPG